VYQGIASPVVFDRSPLGTLAGAPEHGQHTEDVLLDLGFDWDDIVALKQRGVVL
jgi:crotonobetainyl-CoA:carnitine CoA-transferase CaiB-like acyl-CoA transferase